MDKENLGPAEKIVGAILAYVDHMYHGRPGVVSKDAPTATGAKWTYSTHKVEDGKKVAYTITKEGKKSVLRKLGTIQANNQILDDAGRNVGEYRDPGLFPEVAAWIYRQIAEVWKLDNEFAARWASYAFSEENRDLKVALAAFMLCQSRCGDPVLDNGKLAFYDEDFRAVGEAMTLIRRKDKKELRPKDLLRIYDMLRLPQIAEINRELGFGRSARKPFMGRWAKVTQKWLEHREENPKMLQSLVKDGYRTTVMKLAQRIGYKPVSPRFFEILRWKQEQAKDGHRSIAIGQAVAAAESWEDLNEVQVCEKIVKEKPGYKRIISLVPTKVGITRAVMMATIEAGVLTDKDIIILAPTLEELGLLEMQEVKDRFDKAVKKADDMRASNIAQRIKSTEVKEKLQEASDNAVKKAVEEVTRGLRVYFMVDISGSMDGAIDAAKSYIAKFLQGFPPDRVHVATFQTVGREIKIPHASAAGVENAFRGIKAGGGTAYEAGVRVLQQYKPKPEEDSLFIFVGDERNHDVDCATFEAEVRASGLNPTAFGLVRVVGAMVGGKFIHHTGTFTNRLGDQGGRAVRETANRLGIPCFMIDEKTFDDPYAIPKTIRALAAATPVNQTQRAAPAVRVTLVDTILKTELLKPPAWAVA